MTHESIIQLGFIRVGNVYRMPNFKLYNTSEIVNSRYVKGATYFHTWRISYKSGEDVEVKTIDEVKAFITENAP